MIDVKRYSIVTDSMDIRAYYVLASDYDALAQRCRELEGRADALSQELQAALSDWNDLVRAIQSPTHGGAVGHAAGVVRERAALRAEVESLVRQLRIEQADTERFADENGKLRAEVEVLRKDAARLQWLAENMRLMSGHKDTGHYQLPELCDWVESGRECCTLEDLRAALDATPEAL